MYEHPGTNSDSARAARRKRTRCEIVADAEQAYAKYPDEMPAEAMRFEQLGWSMSFELAPRCDDERCDICH
jgi:hypothetical protein